jgi:large subunit ribosomal protein L29
VAKDTLDDLDDDELFEQLAETKDELFRLRFQHATGQLTNYRRLGQTRRTIARLETEVRAREIAAAEAEDAADGADGADEEARESAASRLRRLRRRKSERPAPQPTEEAPSDEVDVEDATTVDDTNAEGVEELENEGDDEAEPFEDELEDEEEPAAKPRRRLGRRRRQAEAIADDETTDVGDVDTAEEKP